ncbi:hypothetical protein HRbin01_00066 [archaeon HR01]|nr:hypothetical protein HRbin01_00066 [archaeon HR01]
MCIFRISRTRKYFCGKRYPLPCSPQVCPFGDVLWRGLVNRDYKAETFWLMPEMRPATPEEAWNALRTGAAEYVVKEMSFRVGGNVGGAHRKSPQHG